MKRNLILVLLILAGFMLVFAVSLYGGAKVDRWFEDRDNVSIVHEDDPGWDCTTMGNRICGPIVATP